MSSTVESIKFTSDNARSGTGSRPQGYDTMPAALLLLLLAASGFFTGFSRAQDMSGEQGRRVGERHS